MPPYGFHVLARNEHLTLASPEDASGRRLILEFIRQRFLEHFGASIDDDSPTLVGVFGADDRLVAAFGLRSADSGFFCEHYLDEALELALQRQLVGPVVRGEIVEITHLCATLRGSLGHLAALLPVALLDRGYRYLACTATACVATYLVRKGLPAVHLGAASASALPVGTANRWGSYYQANPRVLAGDLRLALPTAVDDARQVAC